MKASKFYLDLFKIFSTGLDDLKEKLATVTATLERINLLKNKSQTFFNQIKAERQRIGLLKNVSVDIENELQVTKNTIQDVKNVI